MTHIRPQIGGGGGEGGGAVSVEASDPRGRKQEGGQARAPLREDYKEVQGSSEDGHTGAQVGCHPCGQRMHRGRKKGSSQAALS